MDNKNLNRSYEGLYSEMNERAEILHESNKGRIKRGLIALVVLPIVLIAIRAITNSDKVLFLIIWILCMFVLCAYLMLIEYLDDFVLKTLNDAADQEAEFDDLFVGPDAIEGKVREHIEERKAARAIAEKESAERREAAKRAIAERREAAKQALADKIAAERRRFASTDKDAPDKDISEIDAPGTDAPDTDSISQKGGAEE